jgi:hypothetical protein
VIHKTLRKVVLVTLDMNAAIEEMLQAVLCWVFAKAIQGGPVRELTKRVSACH